MWRDDPCVDNSSMEIIMGRIRCIFGLGSSSSSCFGLSPPEETSRGIFHETGLCSVLLFAPWVLVVTLTPLLPPLSSPCSAPFLWSAHPVNTFWPPLKHLTDYSATSFSSCSLTVGATFRPGIFFFFYNGCTEQYILFILFEPCRTQNLHWTLHTPTSMICKDREWMY